MDVIEVKINNFPITLGQFLKFADLAPDGLEAKKLIIEGKIHVNGSPEYRRGRKLYSGDLVTCQTTSYVCRS